MHELRTVTFTGDNGRSYYARPKDALREIVRYAVERTAAAEDAAQLAVRSFALQCEAYAAQAAERHLWHGFHDATLDYQGRAKAEEHGAWTLVYELRRMNEPLPAPSTYEAERDAFAADDPDDAVQAAE